MFGVVAKLFHGTLTRSILSLLCPFGHCGAGIAGSKKAPGSLSPEPVHMSKATWKANPGESPFLYESMGSVPWGLRHAGVHVHIHTLSDARLPSYVHTKVPGKATEDSHARAPTHLLLLCDPMRVRFKASHVQHVSIGELAFMPMLCSCGLRARRQFLLHG